MSTKSQGIWRLSCSLFSAPSLALCIISGKSTYHLTKPEGVSLLILDFIPYPRSNLFLQRNTVLASKQRRWSDEICQDGVLVHEKVLPSIRQRIKLSAGKGIVSLSLLYSLSWSLFLNWSLPCRFLCYVLGPFFFPHSLSNCHLFFRRLRSTLEQLTANRDSNGGNTRRPL